MAATEWIQKEIVLPPMPRGFNLVTREILALVPELGKFEVGTAHFFIKHTSASLSINENADADVRLDLETHLRKMVPDGAPHFRHTLEGQDDMSAHVKASLLGASLTIPVTGGRLNLGTWQGIYLCEHRSGQPGRSVVVTICGKSA